MSARDSSDIGPCIHGRDPRTRCDVEACHAPPKPRGKRRVLAFMVRDGTERGEGRYLSPNDGVWGDRWEAIVFAPTFRARGNARAFAKNHGGRVVAIVRREPRDVQRLTEEHAALTAEVARLTANDAEWLRRHVDTRAALGVDAGGSLIDAAKRLTARVASLADVEADRDRLRLACDAIAEERDAWKARAEAAEGRYERLLTEAVRIDSAAEERIRADERAACAAWLCEGHQGSLATAMLRARGTPAPARVLRDGEGGCEPLPTPPKPQPAAGLYALSEVGYVLTRRGCDLLDALARKP